MKRLIVLALAITAAAMSSMADTETVGGYTWTYSVGNGLNGSSATIQGTYDANTYNYVPAISPLPDGPVAIPATLGGVPVTSIGQYAFNGCAGMTAVTIPDSVTYIGWYAFNGCSGLTSMTIPKGVYGIQSAFVGCTSLASFVVAEDNANYKTDSHPPLSIDVLIA